MKFTQPIMRNGKPTPGRWWTEDRGYSIERFTYKPNGSGKILKCDPWFAVYKYPRGNRIVDEDYNMTFKMAVAAAEAHALEEKKHASE
jgi:hypothetical protein